MMDCQGLETPRSGDEALEKPRVAVFGSFYRGFYVLKELLSGAVSDSVMVVGVATDDPDNSFVTPQRRVWQYPHRPEEREMVKNLATEAGIEVYRGRVKTPEFYQLFESAWRPDLCIMATFGQKIDRRLYSFPRLGFYNLHPCIEDAWPSRYAGSNPFRELLADKWDHAVVAMHRVNDDFDAGELIAYSDPIYIPDHASVIDLHKITSPIAGKFAADRIAKVIESHVVSRRPPYTLMPLTTHSSKQGK